MRLTEGQIRQIIREVLSDRSPEFPPGTHEKLRLLVQVFLRTLRKELENNPDALRYMELTDKMPTSVGEDPDGDGGGNDLDTMQSWDSIDEFEEEQYNLYNRLSENVPASFQALTRTINHLVMSNWVRDQTSDPDDAELLVGYDPTGLVSRAVVSLAMNAVQLDPSANNAITRERNLVANFVNSLPMQWMHEIWRLRKEAGVDNPYRVQEKT